MFDACAATNRQGEEKKNRWAALWGGTESRTVPLKTSDGESRTLRRSSSVQFRLSCTGAGSKHTVLDARTHARTHKRTYAHINARVLQENLPQQIAPHCGFHISATQTPQCRTTDDTAEAGSRFPRKSASEIHIFKRRACSILGGF